MAYTISGTVTTVQSGSTLDALYFGQENSGRYKRTVDRTVILSFDSTPGPTSVQEGRVGDACFSVTTQQHTLNWSATINQTITLETTTAVAKFLKKHSTTLVVTGVVLGIVTGGAAFFFESAVVGFIGGLTAVVSGTGGLLGMLASTETTVTQETFSERGSTAYTSYVVTLIECRPEHGDIELPVPASSPELAEQEAAREVFNDLGKAT